MKLSSWIVRRPVCYLISLILVVLSLSGLLIPLWINRVERIKNEVELVNFKFNRELFSGIQRTAALLSPINASATNLARVLNSSLDEKKLSFSNIESKVGFTLFQALSTIPHLSEISYVGLDGLFFGYYTEGDQIFALYSNSTSSSTENDAKNPTWYVQPATRDTGKLYGEAEMSPPSDLINLSWFQSVMNSTNGYASLVTGRGNYSDTLLMSTAAINGRGAISLGFPMKSIVNYLTSDVASYDGSLYLATLDGNVLIEGIPNTRMILNGNQNSIRSLGLKDDQVGEVGNVTCQLGKGTLRGSTLSISNKKYVINCSPIEIAGLKLVYALALPHDDLSSNIHKNIRLAVVILIVMTCVMVIIVCTFMYLIIKVARREMHLCGALIKQMEATQQAERKSMQKSLAFASASHDVRASLAGITGLIEISLDEVSKRDRGRSEFRTNLLQMKACTKDLLNILNSILDTNKIECGKMQLEEEEFDIGQLLEDVVDLFHPVGMKKGVDVILDPYDGSVKKASRVKGDRGKLKQILSNLLSNAVKFTSDGHVTVRAWTRKPTLENELLPSNGNDSISCFSCFLFRIDKAYSESEVVSTTQRDQNCMEFVFEVKDTGKGIPKEKQKSVFENYVQVKDTAIGQEGTGLGLGIVQSLVRLMGGEIQIVDKEVGEKGTCFRFYAFFSTCDTNSSTHAREPDIEAKSNYNSSDSFHHSGPIIRTHSPKTEGSHVILFLQSAKRTNILQNFMIRLGIKVHVVKKHEQLSPTLMKIKRKLNSSRYYSSSLSDVNSRSDKEVPLSSLDGMDNVLSSQKKVNTCSLAFVLIVIDTRAGPFRQISRGVADFRKNLDTTCSRVVWLGNPGVGTDNFQGLDEDKLPPSDLYMSKPLHGSRLYQIMGLLPEFADMSIQTRSEVRARNFSAVETTTSNVKEKLDLQSFANNKGEEIEKTKSLSCEKPLTGKKILVVDDDPTGRKIAEVTAKRLGAIISSCENGEEALKLVFKSLDDAAASKNSVPYDCLLMDCQMPRMDGIEATRRIREVEGKYGVRIPIIALTAHEKGGEEINMMFQAGVDDYLTKPLNKENFLKALSELSVNTFSKVV